MTRRDLFLRLAAASGILATSSKKILLPIPLKEAPPIAYGAHQSSVLADKIDEDYIMCYYVEGSLVSKYEYYEWNNYDQ